jgi:hypothetical protein
MLSKPLPLYPHLSQSKRGDPPRIIRVKVVALKRRSDLAVPERRRGETGHIALNVEGKSRLQKNDVDITTIVEEMSVQLSMHEVLVDQSQSIIQSLDPVLDRDLDLVVYSNQLGYFRLDFVLLRFLFFSDRDCIFLFACYLC